MIDNLLPLLFGLAVICVGALALGFIADGLGKFRAPIRKTEESYDERWTKYNKQWQVKPHLHVVPEVIDLREAFEPARVYDQSIDGYI